MNDEPLPPADVLEHAQFVRRLAAHLLRDDAAADDASQETLARALERPPRRGPRIRAWFSAVLRNVVRKGRRGDVRRSRREGVAARPESTCAAADAAAREEILRAVTDAVRALDPVSREAILLRHYEDLPPRAIALRLGVPLETVKSRLERAHARLRGLLSERRGGNAEGWRSALVGLVGFDGIRGGIAPAGGGIAMGTATKVGIGVAAAALVGGGAWLVASRGSDVPRAATAPPTQVSRTESGTPAAAPCLAARPTVSPVPTPPSATTSATDDLPAGWVRKTIGRLSVAVPGEWKEEPEPDEGSVTWSVTDADGKLVSAFAVMPFALGQKMLAQLPTPTRRTIPILGRTAQWSEGRAEGKVAVHVAFDTPEPGTPGVDFVAMAPEDRWPAHEALVTRALGLLRSTAAPEPPPAASPGETEPSAAFVADSAGPVAANRVEGRVFHGTRPVVGASVTLLRAHTIPVGQAPLPPDVARTGRTREDGSFTLGEIEPGSYGLKVEADALGTQTVAPVEVRARDERVARTVIVFGDAEVSGRLWNRDGRPATGIHVRAVPTSKQPWARALVRAVAGAEGAFRLPHLTSGKWQISASLDEASNRFDDSRDAVVDLAPGESKVVLLGSETPEPFWRGTIRHASGSLVTVPGAYVQARGTNPPGVFALRPDADGHFEWQMPAGTYALTVSCIGLTKAAFAETVVLGEGGLTHDIVVPGVSVTCRVIDSATGKPFPSRPRSEVASAYIRPADREARPDDGRLPVEEDGAVRFCGVLAGRYVLWASPPFREPGEGAPVTIDVTEGRDVSGVVLEVRAK